MVDPKWIALAEEKCLEQGIPLAKTESWREGRWPYSL